MRWPILNRAAVTEVAWESRPEPVRMGEMAVRALDEAPWGLSIHGLGSCVAVFLYEPGLRVGGLAHVMLPEPARRSPLTSPARFAATAVAAMIDAILQKGGRRERLRAKIAGGAHLFTWVPAGGESLGDRNVKATLRALATETIALSGMDVGGSCGRTVVADIATGRLHVSGFRRSAREF